MTRCFGDFERGGQLTYWPNDDGRKLLEHLRENRSVTVDTRRNFTLFDGRRAHRVAAFTGGDRYSLVFFSVQSWATGPRDELPEGTTYPTDDSLRYFNRLVAPARGDAGSILAAFGRKPRPQILCWPRVNIDHLAATALRRIAAYTTRKKAKALRAVSRCFAQALLGGKKTKTKTRKCRSLGKKESHVCLVYSYSDFLIAISSCAHAFVQLTLLAFKAVHTHWCLCWYLPWRLPISLRMRSAAFHRCLFALIATLALRSKQLP